MVNSLTLQSIADSDAGGRDGGDGGPPDSVRETIIQTTLPWTHIVATKERKAVMLFCVPVFPIMARSLVIGSKTQETGTGSRSQEQETMKTPSNSI